MIGRSAQAWREVESGIQMEMQTERENAGMVKRYTDASGRDLDDGGWEVQVLHGRGCRNGVM